MQRDYPNVDTRIGGRDSGAIENHAVSNINTRRRLDMAFYEMTGTIKIVLDKKTFNSGFTKREFVVTVPF